MQAILNPVGPGELSYLFKMANSVSCHEVWAAVDDVSLKNQTSFSIQKGSQKRHLLWLGFIIHILPITHQQGLVGGISLPTLICYGITMITFYYFRKDLNKLSALGENSHTLNFRHVAHVLIRRNPTFLWGLLTFLWPWWRQSEESII